MCLIHHFGEGQTFVRQTSEKVKDGQDNAQGSHTLSGGIKCEMQDISSDETSQIRLVELQTDDTHVRCELLSNVYWNYKHYANCSPMSNWLGPSTLSGWKTEPIV